MHPLNLRAIENLEDGHLRRPAWSRSTRDHMVIWLTDDGVMGYRGAFSNHATPEDEWNRRTITWKIQPDLRAAAVQEAILDNLALFERVHAGHDVVWDGRKMVGRLDEDAQAADEEIEGLLTGLGTNDDDKITRYDAGFWFSNVKDMFAGYDDDDELEALVRGEVHDGEPFYAGEGWVVIDVDDALEYAREVRDDYARQQEKE